MRHLARSFHRSRLALIRVRHVGNGIACRVEPVQARGLAMIVHWFTVANYSITFAIRSGSDSQACQRSR